MFEEKVEGISIDGQIYDTRGIVNKVAPPSTPGAP
jgi:hypothetical protein